MSLKEYIAAMEQAGYSADIVLSAMQRHAAYVEENGLPYYSCGDYHTGTEEQESAIRYSRECRKMIEAEQNRRNRGSSPSCGVEIGPCTM